MANRSISDDVIAEIRARCSIVDVVGTVVPLKRAGSGRFKGLCPFHQEKTPSFTVDEGKGFFHCFGCGKSGDAFRFVMERENVDFPNAVHILASRCGVVIPEYTSPAEAAEDRHRADARVRLYELHEKFTTFFQENLARPGNPALDYLTRRKIPSEIIRDFRLGYAPDEWDACLRYGCNVLGYSKEEMLSSGIVQQSESGRAYDQFKGRLTFPIANEQGKIVGFSARILSADDKVAKYKNTPETPIFKKSHLLYALHLARRKMPEQAMAILCEGQLDTIAMHRAGFACAVAPQGTALTEDQLRILRRYTDRILLGFDADGAGQKAILRALGLALPLDFSVGVISFPGGKDPDELFREQGADAVRHAVENAVDWMDFLVGKLREKYRVTEPFECAKAVDEAAELLAKITNPVAVEAYIRVLAGRFALPVETIAAVVKKLRMQNQRRLNGSGGAFAGGAPPAVAGEVKAAAESLTAANPAEKLLLLLALAYPDVARNLVERLPAEHISKSPVGAALNLVLAGAANGESQEAAHELASRMGETPDSDIAECLLGSDMYTSEQAFPAMEDALKELERRRGLARSKNLEASLRAATTAEERMKILQEMMELAKR
ncbi:MAG: DNA primase [Victivallaceae bacterium]|nr:DNA primase [Victivallaceae bacterium]